MEDRYSTIQQHQPLRVPTKWDKQEKAFVVQLEEVLDDIYRRFGRLRLQDLSKTFQKRIEDDEGNIAELDLDVDGLALRVGNAEGDITELGVSVGGLAVRVGNAEGDITELGVSVSGLAVRVGDAEGNITDLGVSVSGLTVRVGDAEGDISALQLRAGQIELAVADKYNKVSGITINSSGIDIAGSKYVKIESGCSLDIASGGDINILSGGTFTVHGGNFAIDSSGNATFKGGGQFSGELLAATGTFAGTLSAACITSGTLSAERIGSGSITTAKLDTGAVTAIKIDTGAVTADKIDTGAVTTAKLYAGAVTTAKLDTGAVTTAKIDTGAVTTEKLYSFAVTTEKLASGAVTADKIDANDISAINAKLNIASIVNAQIENANINYAHIMDINANKAIFSSAVMQEGTANKLYINRLAVTYGQLIEATIGDLVIGASDGYYYHIDVSWDANGVPTLVPTRVGTPSASEIAAGHTSGGKTIVQDVGTYSAISCTNFYAIDAIIDTIYAKRIDVDELWARQAFIDKLMVTDISSNTYIQSTIGNWNNSSTITQTINGLVSTVSRQNSVYIQENEPSHTGLQVGDIWIKTTDTSSWQDVEDGFDSWQDVLDSVSSWHDLTGVPTLYVWDGEAFKEIYDAFVDIALQTQLIQTEEEITLVASRVSVNESDIESLQSSLSVTAEAIAAEVTRATTAEGGKISVTNVYQTADDIYLGAKSYTDSNAYLIKSGIDINSNGIDITGGKYVKIKSGNDVKILLDGNGIDMQTAGKFRLHAQDSSNSSIIFGSSASNANFSVGMSGDVHCKSLTVDGTLVTGGSSTPNIIISQDEPSGSNVLWVKPGNSGVHNINYRPSTLVMSSGGSLGYYIEYQIPYTANDYVSGTDLFYGIKARYQFYNMSGYASRTLKAYVWANNSYHEIGSVTATVGMWNTLVLDTMISSAISSSGLSSTGGSIWIKFESNASSAEAMFLNEDMVVKVQNTGTSSFSACTVYYKQ